MCLAVPGKVVAIFEENGLLMGNVDFSGTVNVTCMAYVPEVKLGQYVIVHAGFAISILDEEEAQEVFKAFGELEERIREENSRLQNKSGPSSLGELN
jgi:hydrogenase expression/formation protein HypC